MTPLDNADEQCPHRDWPEIEEDLREEVMFQVFREDLAVLFLLILFAWCVFAMKTESWEEV